MHPLQSTLQQASNSTPDLSIMPAATTQVVEGLPQTKVIPSENASLNSNTLHVYPHPRTPSSASTASSRNDSVLEVNHHPDLNDEVSKLNDKLINAINHQASLDESLQQTRRQLDMAKQQIASLEEESRLQRQRAEENEASLKREMASEKSLRLKAESDKKSMEQEVETLTSVLFTEANTMVSDARKEKDASERKVEQLRSQLQDSEVLLQSHQDQLTDLKMVLEKMTADETESESATQTSANSPTSPIMAPHDRSFRSFPSTQQGTNQNATIDSVPESPLHFSHLLQPVLRTDVTAYMEFATLIKQATAASPTSSRVVSGSYSSLSVTNLGTASSTQLPTPAIGAFPAIATSVSPKTPVNVPEAPIMRDSKVYKRVLTEDIEPTLRLDIAPGISWMGRKPIVNSMIEGSLVVEPMPPSPVKGRGLVNQCSLCAENRVGELYSRKHRFRISEDKDSKRYPLCDLCLGRLRSCCELLSFLRMVTGGHWKADSEDEVKSAWEEFIKLRERMFWHRVAGGVVPIIYHREPSTRSSRPSLDAPEATRQDDASTEQESDTFNTPSGTPRPDVTEDPIDASN